MYREFAPALTDAEMGGSARSIRRRVDGIYIYIYIYTYICYTYMYVDL